jgi:hypothetical protein
LQRRILLICMDGVVLVSVCSKLCTHRQPREEVD